MVLLECPLEEPEQTLKDGEKLAVWISTTASKYRLYVGRVFSAAVFFCACVFSTNSLAIDPAPVKWGVFDFTPTLTADFSRDDNIFQRDQEAVSSFISIIAPQLEISMQNNNSRYALTLEVIEGTYSNSPEDEYTDWNLGGNVYHEFNSRNALTANITYGRGHENRGTDLTRYSELPENILLFDELQYDMTYTYGSDSARGRLVFEYLGEAKTYASVGEVTAGQDLRRHEVSGAFHYAALGGTKFFVEMRHADIAYSDGSQLAITAQESRDSSETYTYLGMNWDSSSQFNGDFKVGNGSKEFATGSSSDSNNISYAGRLEWSPLSYSRLSLRANQKFDESLGFADARMRVDTTLRWDHVWNNRLRSVVSISHLDFDYIGEDLSEQYTDFSIGFTYSVTRWLDLRLELLNNKLVSSEEGFGFQQNNILVGFNASL